MIYNILEFLFRIILKINYDRLISIILKLASTDSTIEDQRTMPE